MPSWRKSRRKGILRREYFREEKSVYANTVRKLEGTLAYLVQADEHKTLIQHIHRILPSRRTARVGPLCSKRIRLYKPRFWDLVGFQWVAGRGRLALRTDAREG